MKIVVLLIALAFAAPFAAPAFAQSVDATKLAAACKGMKTGQMVRVDGKEVKCP